MVRTAYCLNFITLNSWQLRGIFSMTPLPNSQQRTLGRRRQFFFDFLSRNLDERSFLLSQLFSLPFPVAKAHSQLYNQSSERSSHCVHFLNELQIKGIIKQIPPSRYRPQKGWKITTQFNIASENSYFLTTIEF